MIKKILLWLVIFIFGFMVGTGVGFKILQGVSGELLEEAFQNSYAQLQQQYAGSNAQVALEQQKNLFLEQLKGGLKDYIMKFLGK